MKKAIVVGATSGIGREVACLLARRGWLVGIAGRRMEELERLAAEQDGIVAWRRIDVMQDEAARLLHELADEMGGIDLYFHASGIGFQNVALAPCEEISTVRTNAEGFTRMLTAAFNMFAGQGGGQIAAITSIAGTKGLGAAPAYSATKRYQRHYLECLEQLSHIRRLPIAFTEIRPGFVRTPLLKDGHYPMQLDASEVARSIVKAVEKRRRVATIDWRYRLLVFFWNLIPRCLWVRMKVRSTQ